MTSLSHSPLKEEPRLAAIVLAAGYSSRMGQFKPLLSVGTRTAVEAVVQSFLAAGVLDVCVVLGHRANDLRPVVEAAGARCAINSNFDLGMYSSVCAGVAAISTSTDACFVTPADIPLVRVSTIRRLARFYAETRQGIIYPIFNGDRGHPTLISRAILAEALDRGPDSRLSTLLSAHEEECSSLFVPDEGIHLDMDTPDDLARVQELAIHREIPSLQECEAILAMYQPNERVVRHSRMVACVAQEIAVALAERDIKINPLLARAGGLLHDVAKGKPDHAAAGAQLLRDLEFENVADVVAAHTDCTFTGRLDEAAIVYLADKLVSGERIVGLERRFENALERFREDPVALAAALQRRATAEAIAHRIENSLGIELPLFISNLSASENFVSR
jgi:putative nucleotidyltransferase with HDIG domain